MFDRERLFQEWQKQLVASAVLASPLYLIVDFDALEVKRMSTIYLLSRASCARTIIFTAGAGMTSANANDD